MVGTLVLGTSAEMRQGSSPYLGTQMLEWWNWQARQIQNLLSRNTRVGSTPTFSTMKYAGMMELVGMMDLKSIEQKCSCGFNSHFQYEVFGRSKLCGDQSRKTPLKIKLKPTYGLFVHWLGCYLVTVVSWVRFPDRPLLYFAGVVQWQHARLISLRRGSNPTPATKNPLIEARQ